MKLRLSRIAPAILLFAAALLAVIWIARTLGGGYTRAVESGTTDIEVVRQFDRLFPSSTHFISYYTGTSGDPTWNSKVGLHGRYILTMQMPVALEGWERNRVVPHGSPTFYLSEVQSFSPLSNGRTSVEYGETHITFGLPEWKKLVESGGDLNVLGVKIKTDKKILGFDKNREKG